MRRVLQEVLQHRNLPLIMAHRGSVGKGRENSIAAIREALTFSADIIEVDVRMSRNGVVYCHHGSIPFGVLAAQLFRFPTFTKTQRLVGKRDSARRSRG